MQSITQKYLVMPLMKHAAAATATGNQVGTSRSESMNAVGVELFIRKKCGAEVSAT